MVWDDEDDDLKIFSDIEDNDTVFDEESDDPEESLEDEEESEEDEEDMDEDDEEDEEEEEEEPELDFDNPVIQSRRRRQDYHDPADHDPDRFPEV